MANFKQGHETHQIPMTLFRDNRLKVRFRIFLRLDHLFYNFQVIEALKKDNAIVRNSDTAVILLEGGDSIGFYDTDTDYLFRQESYFQYLFGVSEPGFFGVVNVKDGFTTLFAPRLPEGYFLVTRFI